MHKHWTETRSDLPHGWVRPTQSRHGGQLSLFQSAAEDFGVAKDELWQWHERGWISFNPDAADYLTPDETDEIIFVRDLRSSGIGDASIELLLRDLPKPYQYNPTLTAYNFELGWVQLPPIPSVDDIDELIDSEMDGYLARRAQDADIGRLSDLAAAIRSAVALANKQKRKRVSD